MVQHQQWSQKVQTGFFKGPKRHMDCTIQKSTEMETARASVKNIYKDDGLSVEKYECIGHVQKRMGAALRKLKKEKKELGGKGTLTSKTIDKFQNYYGMALRSNIGNLKSMKKAILATLFHCSSSEKKRVS